MTTTVNFPTILVIFGATGDLMEKKIVPALYHLFQKGKLPPLMQIIGFSRQPLNNIEFRARVEEMLNKHREHRVDPEILKKFLALFFYEPGQFDRSFDYQNLGKKLGQVDGAWRTCANKLFYLAVPPSLYENIFNNLASSGLTKPCSSEEGWTRILVEKPFGNDLNTAKKLDKILGTLFREMQIYRIDHYLAKEMLQNILTFRFSNNLFASHWSNKEIESIEVRILEKIGIEDRGTFYDGVGALRDIGQNHLLQMLSLVTMNHPGDLRASAIRLARAKILRKLTLLNDREISQNTQRAQYEGYRDIPGVEKNSTTETYFKIKTFINITTWRKVPITIEGGKKSTEEKKEIIVTFRHPEPCLCSTNPTEANKNKIIFSLAPHEGIAIKCWFKRPGLDFELEEHSFEFNLHAGHNSNLYAEEYEKLLLDCIEGDQTLFVSTAEINAMWKFIDPIISGWKKDLVPLETY